MNTNPALDLKNLIKKNGSKKEADKAIKMMNEIDFVVRRNKPSATEAAGILTALADTYRRFALNTTIIEPKEKAEESIAKPKLS